MKQRCARAGMLLLASFAVGLPTARGQAGAPDDPRPRIGVVLAGGGARGAAHIGVLKMLEEMRIPVDQLAGTSMGSLVGGLYAAGYSPGEIGRILGGIDWSLLFRDTPERREMSFRRKEDDDLALFPIEFGIGPRGMSAPSGVVAGRRIDFLLRSLTLGVSDLASFDLLPVPFRAVAADLLTGKPVMLDHGDLARAMRASMSIPAVFAPVEIDGRLLVDGGIVMNLPVQVVQEMGADRIIAINVGTPPRREVDYLSAVGVYSQTFAVMGERNVTEQMARLRPEDLLITPDLEGIGSGSFGKIAAAMAAGEKAARAAEPALSDFSVSEEEYAAFLKRQRRDPASLRPAPRIDEIRIEGTQRVDPQVLRRRIRTREGEPLDLQRLAGDLKRISQAGEYESVGYRIDRESGTNTLVIETKDKWWGPGFLRFGVGLESTAKGDAERRLIANYRQTGLNRLGAEWKTIVSVGEPLALVSEFYQPLERSLSFFVAPRLMFQRERGDTYLDNGDLEELKIRRLGGGLDLGVQVGNYGEVRLGLFSGRLRVVSHTESAFQPVSRGEGGARLKLRFDRVDNVFFPTRGNLTDIEATSSMNGLGADDDVDKLELRSFQAIPAGRGVLVCAIRAATDLGSDLPFYDQFTLGGLFNLSGVPRGKLRGDVMGLATLGGYVRIGRLGELGRLYAGALAQSGNVWADAGDVSLEHLVYSGTFFFGVDNKFAPVHVGYGLAEGGEGSAYVSIGRPFAR